MILFENKKYKIDTNDNFETVVSKLKQNTIEYNPLIEFSTDTKFFGGYISGSNFKIRRHTIINARSKPFFKGTIVKTSYGCSIQLEFSTSLWIEIMVIFIWLFVLYNLFFIIKTNNAILNIATIPILLTTLIVTLCIPYFHKRERIKAIDKMNEIFHTPGGLKVKYKTNLKNLNASS